MAYHGTFSQAGGMPRACRQVDTRRAQELISENGALVVDVREPSELALGRIPGSELIPLREIGSRIDGLRQQGDRPIILSCRSGNRSEMACRFLREQGIANVYNLAGGFNAWVRDEPAPA